MHSMRSFQRQVELRRLGNQLPMLGKANSLFKLVNCCVFCLFVKLRLSPHCIGPGSYNQYPNRDCQREAIFFNFQSVPTRSLFSLVG